jgi:FkbM family methyltransferase
MNRSIAFLKRGLFYIVNFPFKIFGFEIRRLPMHGLDLLCYHTHLKRELLLPLTGDSIFIDVGGYEGMHTQAIYEEYKCNIICFEPAMGAFKKLEGKFYGVGKIKLESLAATDHDGKAFLYHKQNENGNSLYKDLLKITDDSQSDKEKVETVNFASYLVHNNITHV